MAYQTLQVSESDRVVTLTIQRPEKLNALNSTVITELSAAFSGLAGPGSTARAAILTGAGQKAFVAGADVAEMTRMTTVEAKLFSEAGHRLCALIEHAPCPVIAAVNGFALGGGTELALSCDFIYASDKAKFGQPEVTLGLMPGFGGTQRLARRIGIARARELIYTGDVINAERALAIGLVNEVVPATELSTRVEAVARKIASRAPLAVAASKRVMLHGYNADLAAACELETAAFAALFGTEDQREGTRAFVDKQKAEFHGR